MPRSVNAVIATGLEAPQLHTPEPDPRPRQAPNTSPDDGSTVVHFSVGLVTGATFALFAYWFVAFSRLGGELVQALGSRGNPPKYRHRINWRG
jgi:hypothetical protein